MFQELLPNNKELGMVLDTVLITLGGIGGVAGLVTYRWKTKYQAKIQAEMQAKADELSQTLNEKITRRSKAFDLRILKQYEFYEKFGTMIQSLMGQSNFVYISIDLIVNTNMTFIGEDNEVIFDKNADKAHAIKILKPEYKKFLELVSGFEALITSYSFYLDTETCEICQNCYSLYRTYSLEIHKYIMLIENAQEIDWEANNFEGYYGKAVDSLRKVGDAIKERIEVDSRQ